MRSLSFFVLFVSILVGKVQGQSTNYPLTLHPQLTPPQSVFISDYAQPGNEQFRLIVTKNDLSSTIYQTRFKFFIKRNGSEVIRLKQNFVAPPTTLDQNPQLLSGVDLSPYFNHLNWDFVGSVNAANYAQTKALPEGFYEFCFVAYDILRPEVAVSAVSCLGVFLSKNDVPLLNTPACGVDLPAKNPQQLVFSWFPRHLSSPGAAQNTEYKFQLFEVSPKGTPANQAVLSSAPVYQETTEQTQIVYGVDKPLLLDTMQYVWRVQALDKTGKDGFQNQGYSQVCTFNYVKALLPAEMVGVPINFTGEAINKQTIQYKWKVAPLDTFDLFRLEVRKAGTNNEWFAEQVKTKERTSYEFEPNTVYEARLRGRWGERWGEYTPLILITTPEDAPAVCGTTNMFPQADTLKPLSVLPTGTYFEARGIGMEIVEATPTGQAGYFSGKAAVVTPYLGAKFKATFDNLYLDESLKVGKGRIDFVTQGIGVLFDTSTPEGATRAKIVELANKIHRADSISLTELDSWATDFLTWDWSVINSSLAINATERGLLNTLKELIAAEAIAIPPTIPNPNNMRGAFKSNAALIKKLADGLTGDIFDGLGLGRSTILSEVIRNFYNELTQYMITKDNSSLLERFLLKNDLEKMDILIKLQELQQDTIKMRKLQYIIFDTKANEDFHNALAPKYTADTHTAVEWQEWRTVVGEYLPESLGIDLCANMKNHTIRPGAQQLSGIMKLYFPCYGAEKERLLNRKLLLAMMCNGIYTDELLTIGRIIKIPITEAEMVAQGACQFDWDKMPYLDNGNPEVALVRRLATQYNKKISAHHFLDYTRTQALTALNNPEKSPFWHIVTHGICGQLGYLVLKSGVGSITSDDILSMDYGSPELVWLHCCETAIMGDHSVINAFLANKAKVGIGSNWNVNDGFAPTFVEAFYDRYWGQNKDVQIALLEVRRAFVKTHSPYLWAIYECFDARYKKEYIPTQSNEVKVEIYLVGNDVYAKIRLPNGEVHTKKLENKKYLYNLLNATASIGASVEGNSAYLSYAALWEPIETVIIGKGITKIFIHISDEIHQMFGRGVSFQSIIYPKDSPEAQTYRFLAGKYHFISLH